MSDDAEWPTESQRSSKDGSQDLYHCDRWDIVQRHGRPPATTGHVVRRWKNMWTADPASGEAGRHAVKALTLRLPGLPTTSPARSRDQDGQVRRSVLASYLASTAHSDEGGDVEALTVYHAKGRVIGIEIWLKGRAAIVLGRRSLQRPMNGKVLVLDAQHFDMSADRLTLVHKS